MSLREFLKSVDEAIAELQAEGVEVRRFEVSWVPNVRMWNLTMVVRMDDFREMIGKRPDR